RLTYAAAPHPYDSRSRGWSLVGLEPPSRLRPRRRARSRAAFVRLPPLREEVLGRFASSCTYGPPARARSRAPRTEGAPPLGQAPAPARTRLASAVPRRPCTRSRWS